MSEASRIPIKPLGIGEVALRVNDLRRSIAFYCETLGFTLVRGAARFDRLRTRGGWSRRTHVSHRLVRQGPAGERRRPKVGRGEPASLDASSLRYRDFAE